MRRHLLNSLRNENIPVQETTIEVDELLQASEIFLTNSVYGIKWVKSCGDSNYIKNVSAMLHKKYVAAMF